MTVRPLLAWIDEPCSDRGIRFAAKGDAWDWWSYASLAARARQVAGGLAAIGVGTEERVAVVLRSGPDFVGTLFGCMLAGVTPCPLAPPLLFQDREPYDAHVRGSLAALRPAAVVAGAELVERLAGLIGPPGARPVLTAEELLAAGDADELGPGGPQADLALVQFTSGSSGQPRGVRVPFAALEANVAAIRRWLAMGSDDPTVSWLPVHHDMGLIGCLVTPVVNLSDLWLLEPERFIRDPLRYLACFGSAGARLSAMPAFGLDHVVRRVPPAALEGLDLSGWRALILGAERIDADSLARFADLLAPHGFDRRAFLPAYGMAEATLAVTGLALDEPARAVAVDPAAVALGSRTGDGGEDPSRPGAVAVVGCGAPLGDTVVDIVGEGGEPLPDGHVGQILVRSSSVAAGYGETSGPASPTRFADGVLHTGDAGFVIDGQLFVLGRLGDSMKVRGRSLFAEDVEIAMADAGIPRGSVAVLLGGTATGATAVVLVERATDEWMEAARKVLRRTAEGAEAVVLDVPRRTILRTTSGKPRRRPLWQAYVEGRLGAPSVTSAPAPASF